MNITEAKRPGTGVREAPDTLVRHPKKPFCSFVPFLKYLMLQVGCLALDPMKLVTGFELHFPNPTNALCWH